MKIYLRFCIKTSYVSLAGLCTRHSNMANGTGDIDENQMGKFNFQIISFYHIFHWWKDAFSDDILAFEWKVNFTTACSRRIVLACGFQSLVCDEPHWSSFLISRFDDAMLYYHNEISETVLNMFHLFYISNFNKDDVTGWYALFILLCNIWT